ncbi:uncharacterized protein LOC126328055 [Schistocerca gregaria]|uniref:uncharacterized protein LOC126328055 n=1 Tax=Schistocerca gregaria TaxID=7010 RepID=UPI00211DCBD2|nr:uncharacterized protein LOC126328055 [Schistocerca gregaria]
MGTKKRALSESQSKCTRSSRSKASNGGGHLDGCVGPPPAAPRERRKDGANETRELDESVLLKCFVELFQVLFPSMGNSSNIHVNLEPASGKSGECRVSISAAHLIETAELKQKVKQIVSRFGKCIGVACLSRNLVLEFTLFSRTSADEFFGKMLNTVRQLIEYSHMVSPGRWLSYSSDKCSVAYPSCAKSGFDTTLLSSMFKSQDFVAAKSPDAPEFRVNSVVMMNVAGFGHRCVSLVFSQNGLPVLEREAAHRELVWSVFNHKCVRNVLNITLERKGCEVEGCELAAFCNAQVPYRGAAVETDDVPPPDNMVIVISQEVKSEKKGMAKLRKFTIESVVGAMLKLSERHPCLLSPKERKKLKVVEEASDSIASSISSIVNISTNQEFVDRCFAAMGMPLNATDQDVELRMKEFQSLLQESVRRAARSANPFEEMISQMSTEEGLEVSGGDEGEGLLEEEMLQQLWIPAGSYMMDESQFIEVLIC